MARALLVPALQLWLSTAASFNPERVRLPEDWYNSSARERIPDSRAVRPGKSKQRLAGRGSSRGVYSSVTNLDAGPIPNAPIPIPNGGTSGPIAFGHYVDGSRRNVNGRWLIVAGAACYRRSKQGTNCQATKNAGGYLTIPCNRSPGCKRQTKTACDQQTNQKLAHFGPLRMGTIV
jgi:hypothetical protein